MAAVGEGGEVEGDDLQVLEVVDDVLDLLVALQPHAQAAVAHLEGVAGFQPQAQRHDQVVAVGDAFEVGVDRQQVPALVDDFAVLNDSLHRRAP
ncbi:hypothetical protein D9M71_747660 [compost metagenome]